MGVDFWGSMRQSLIKSSADGVGELLRFEPEFVILVKFLVIDLADELSGIDVQVEATHLGLAGTMSGQVLTETQG